MTKITIISFFLVFFIGCGSKTDLKFKYKPGRVKKYSLTADLQATITTQNSQKTYKTKGRFIISQKTITVSEQQVATFKFKYDSVSYASEEYDSLENSNIIKTLKNSSILLKTNEYGEITNAEELKNIPRINVGGIDFCKIILKIHPILPQNKIGIGSSWERKHEIPFDSGILKGTMFVYKYYTIVGIENYNSFSCFKIKNKIVIKMDVEKNKHIKSASSTNGIGEGYIYFNNDKGILVYADMNININLVTLLLNQITGEATQVSSNIAQKIILKLKSING